MNCYLRFSFPHARFPCAQVRLMSHFCRKFFQWNWTHFFQRYAKISPHNYDQIDEVFLDRYSSLYSNDLDKLILFLFLYKIYPENFSHSHQIHHLWISLHKPFFANMVWISCHDHWINHCPIDLCRVLCRNQAYYLRPQYFLCCCTKFQSHSSYHF